MKTKLQRMCAAITASYLILNLTARADGPTSTSSGYLQVDLVSDIATNAPHTDPRLVNPWGIIAGPEAVWINDNGPGFTTAYGPFGRLFSFDIHIPAPGGGSGTPSGLVFNNT